ncbi:LptA/OstA family protein [Rickettsiales bacterium]|nr:LptA/OstA family protein [Rickettsiales bacterium]
MIKIIIFFLTFLTSNNLYAIEESVKTNIKSKSITIVKDKNFIEFNDNVLLTREDISFLSNKMLVFTDQEQKMNEKAKIKIVKANGKVKIFNEEFIATGNSGIYDIDKGVFKIFGDVILNEGTKIANGDEFTYDIANKNGFLSNNNPQKNRPTIIINEDLDNLKKDFNENSNN